MRDERREIERAINFWQQRIDELGYPPFKPTDLEFDDLVAGAGENQFIIAVDRTADDDLLLAYGANFARLLGLPTGPGPNVRLIREAPERLWPAFIQGRRDVVPNRPPVRVEGKIDLLSDLRQLYRAAFMPIGVDLVFGAFSCRLVGSKRKRKAAIDRGTADDAAAIATFIRLKGVTRCPTAYAAPTKAAITSVDQAALERYAMDHDWSRQQRTDVGRFSFLAPETRSHK